jgi:23S rRNA U2552 (ribose-2'-O)-methylase RlmE/FtsJ
MNLCYEVLDFAREYLQPGGNLLCKYFQGSDEKVLLQDAKVCG